MILDYNLMFDQAAAITVTRVSTNVIDLLSARDMGMGDDPDLDIMGIVTTAFTGGTSLQGVIQGSVDNSTFTDMASGPVVALANLTQGTYFMTFPMPILAPGQALPRFLRVNYVVVGTMTAGAVTTTLVLDRQRNIGYTPGIAIAN